MAEVKAPRSWPNSSLSISSEGMAAQLTSTNGAGPVAFGVEPAGDEFLARAVLARDQNAGVARCDLVDQTPDVLHLLGSAYDL